MPQLVDVGGEQGNVREPLGHGLVVGDGAQVLHRGPHQARALVAAAVAGLGVSHAAVRFGHAKQKQYRLD